MKGRTAEVAGMGSSNSIHMQNKDGAMLILLPLPENNPGGKAVVPCRIGDMLPADTVTSWIDSSGMVLPASVLKRRKMVIDVSSAEAGSMIAVFPFQSGPTPSGQGMAHVVILGSVPLQLRSLIIPEYDIDNSQVPLLDGGPFNKWLLQASAPWLVLLHRSGKVTSMVQGCYVAPHNVRRLSGYRGRFQRMKV
jgi:hypothetical protein